MNFSPNVFSLMNCNFERKKYLFTIYWHCGGAWMSPSRKILFLSWTDSWKLSDHDCKDLFDFRTEKSRLIFWVFTGNLIWVKLTWPCNLWRKVNKYQGKRIIQKKNCGNSYVWWVFPSISFSCRMRDNPVRGNKEPATEDTLAPDIQDIVHFCMVIL